MKPKLLITIDTELSTFPDGQGLWARVGDQEWGLGRMLGVFQSRCIPATFFLDVYGHDPSDLAEQRRAAELIVASGQDLQLHTHPGPAFDPARPQLRDYSLAEQQDIIEHGRSKILAWTGERPTCHRAGDWGADDTSLKALHSCGMRADFSASPWSTNCGIDRESIARNGWAQIGGMLCGIGTCFRDRITGRIRRVDIGGTSRHEVLDILSRRIDPFVLTLHSFSLVRFNRSRTRFSAEPDYITRLLEVCRIASDVYGYQISTVSQAVTDLELVGEHGLRSSPLPTTTVMASGAGILRSVHGRLVSLSS